MGRHRIGEIVVSRPPFSTRDHRSHRVAIAVDGWGNALKAFAAYKALSIGGGLVPGGRRRVETAKDLYGGLWDAVTSPAAKRARGTDGKLATSSFGAATTGAGKLGGETASPGKTLGSLALRFAPLAMGALKTLGAAAAGLALSVRPVRASSASRLWRESEFFLCTSGTGLAQPGRHHFGGTGADRAPSLPDHDPAGAR